MKKRRVELGRSQLKDPRAAEVLEDRDRLEAMYRRLGSTHKVAAEINCGAQAVLHSLYRLGIEVQKPGGDRGSKKPNPRKEPVKRLSKAQFRKVVQRAYEKAGRCPPGCPGGAQCLGPNGRCIFEKGEDDAR